MGIKVTLYDLFAYTIPGGFYIATFVYFGIVFGLITVDFQTLGNLMATQILALTILAYIAGLVFDPISRPWYYRFFNKSFNDESLAQMSASSPYQITSDPKNWSVLLQFIRTQPNSNADNVDRFNATALLLRNLSFCLLLSGFITIILVIRTNYYLWNIILSLAFFVTSILAGREAARFHRWFYQALYATILAYGSKPSDFIAKKKQNKEKPESGDKGNG